MEYVESVSATIWCVWALIGLVGGIMLGRSSMRGWSYTIMCIVIGAVFSLIGGWAFCSLFGAGEKMQYLSLVIAVLCCSVGLWIFTILSRPRKS